MRVLVTGSSGMVGRNTIDHKKARQFEILAPPRQELDLANYSLLVDFLLETKPDIIVHAAGKVGGIKANIAIRIYTNDSLNRLSSRSGFLSRLNYLALGHMICFRIWAF